MSEARLLAGDFDNAVVELWLVNWQDVAQRLLLRKGHLGEVRFGTLGFTAELRGLSYDEAWIDAAGNAGLSSAVTVYK